MSEKKSDQDIASKQEKADANAEERLDAEKKQAKAEEKAAEKEQKPFKVEGFAIYERAANSFSHVFLAHNSSKEDAERQFRRLHEKGGGIPSDLAIVKFSEVAASQDYYDHPDKYELDDDVPAVDRRT